MFQRNKLYTCISFVCKGCLASLLQDLIISDLLFEKPSHFPYCILTFKRILQTILCEQIDGKLSNILGNKMCIQHD